VGVKIVTLHAVIVSLLMKNESMKGKKKGRKEELDAGCNREANSQGCIQVYQSGHHRLPTTAG
jgi:hypothetical protein